MSFNAFCWSLTGCYMLLAVVALSQLFRLNSRDDCFCDFFRCSSLTFQQELHIVIFLLCTVRAIFFIVATQAWDSVSGEVISDKTLFYTLDEYATVLFFCLTSVLVLFWAEMYHISTDTSDMYSTIVKPVTYIVNVGALVGVAVCAYLVSESYETDVAYVFFQYTVLVVTSYLLSAVMFAYYGYMASSEIKSTPVHLSSRRNRIIFLRILALICISALVSKAVVLLVISGDSIPTSTESEMISVFMYYFFLEMFPVITVLIFYRVEEYGDVTQFAGTASADSYDSSESSPLLGSSTSTGLSIRALSSSGGNSNNSNSNSNMKSSGLLTSPVTTTGSISRSTSLPRGPPKSASAAVVDAVIARISDDNTHFRPSDQAPGSV